MGNDFAFEQKNNDAQPAQSEYEPDVKQSGEEPAESVSLEDLLADARNLIRDEENAPETVKSEAVQGSEQTDVPEETENVLPETQDGTDQHPEAEEEDVLADLLADARSLIGEEPDPGCACGEPEQNTDGDGEPEQEKTDACEQEEAISDESACDAEQEDTESEIPDEVPAEMPVPELKQSPRRLTAYEQSRPSYQVARRAQYEREREEERRTRERRLREREEEELRGMQELEKTVESAKKKKKKKSDADTEYSEWLFSQGTDPETAYQREIVLGEGDPIPPENGKKATRKKSRFLSVFAVLLVLAVVFAAALHFFWLEQPVNEGGTENRKTGSSTILLAGCDRGGYRTDCMMLLNVNRQAHSISLVSVPRDTLIYCEYSVPKINSAYAWASGGKAGMKQLMQRVTEIIGFEPDGYLVIQMDSLEELIDKMGGVRFEVPMDMYYCDEVQDLTIELEEGMQLLNGEQSLQLLRFRSGYPDADLGRVRVQQKFLMSAVEQWTSARSLLRLPGAVEILTENAETSLSEKSLLWIAESLLLCGRGNMQTGTLPGEARMISDGSYYVLDADRVLETVNSMLNPYLEDVTASDLYIREG